MKVKFAYLDRTINICGDHYDSPPAGLPALGQVEDCRERGCIICRPPEHDTRKRDAAIWESIKDDVSPRF